MSTSSAFRIVFFSSSEFVLPIVESIYTTGHNSLGQIAYEQWETLVKTLKKTETLVPASLLDISPELFQLPALAKPVSLELIVSQPDTENHGKIVSNKVVEYARSNNINLYTPTRINEEEGAFRSIAKDFDIAMVASFGQIISAEILATARYGFLNWHPSALPLYRGSTPIQAALKNGEKVTALSWIDMNEQMDAGDIYLQKSFHIDPADTFITLAEKLGQSGANTWALVASLRIIEGLKQEGQEIDCDFVARRQDHIQATKVGKVSKEDRMVSIEKLDANSVYNHYRAHISFPGTTFHSSYFSQIVKLVQASEYVPGQVFSKRIHTAKQVGEFDEWYVLYIGKEQSAYLKCKNGYVRVQKICLENGKTIDFSGYAFQ
jgi:methionyl-tRNA formyltransferase